MENYLLSCLKNKNLLLGENFKWLILVVYFLRLKGLFIFFIVDMLKNKRDKCFVLIIVFLLGDVVK